MYIYIYIYIYIFLLGKNRMWSLTFRNISVVSLTTRLFFLSDVILVISHNLKILLGSSGKKSIDLIYGYGILSMIRSRQGGFFFLLTKDTGYFRFHAAYDVYFPFCKVNGYHVCTSWKTSWNHAWKPIGR